MTMIDTGIKGAVLSSCQHYRFRLWRTWDDSKPSACFIGLNPSTADHLTDDKTIVRCVQFCRSWGYGELIMVNLFAFRAKEPKDMQASEDPIGHNNNQHILACAEDADLVLACWGGGGKFLGRGQAVIDLFNSGVLKCLQQSKNDQSPAHPLYMKGNLKPKTLVLE